MVCSRASTLAAALLFASVTPALANLVTDGGFESCATEGSAPPPGWSGTGACDHFNPQSGSWAGQFTNDVGTLTLSQTIATTPGSSYEFSFWLAFTGADLPSSFIISFGADQVFDLVYPGDAPDFDYIFSDFRVQATGPSTVIDFAINPGDGVAWVDGVSVTSVPEPAAWVMMLIGAVALASLKGNLPLPRRRLKWRGGTAGSQSAPLCL